MQLSRGLASAVYLRWSVRIDPRVGTPLWVLGSPISSLWASGVRRSMASRQRQKREVTPACILRKHGLIGSKQHKQQQRQAHAFCYILTLVTAAAAVSTSSSLYADVCKVFPRGRLTRGHCWRWSRHLNRWTHAARLGRPPYWSEPMRLVRGDHLVTRRSKRGCSAGSVDRGVDSTASFSVGAGSHPILLARLYPGVCRLANGRTHAGHAFGPGGSPA